MGVVCNVSSDARGSVSPEQVSRIVDCACGTGVGHDANASTGRHAMRVIFSVTHVSQVQAVDSTKPNE